MGEGLEGVELVPGVGNLCSMKVFREANCRWLRGRRAWERWGLGVGAFPRWWAWRGNGHSHLG